MAKRKNSTIPTGMRAVVMAGGKGTRLLPYTTLVPKPLVPIGEKPILEFVLASLKRSGIRRATLCVGHLAELIRAYFNDGSKWGVKIEYSVEPKPLSTIGPLAYVDGLGKDFFVMNGDVLTDLDLADLYRAHKESGADLTVATHARQVKIDYGVLNYDNKRRITSFEEKPTIPYHVSMGVYVLNRRCLEWVEKGKPLGFDQLVRLLLENDRPIYAFPYKGRWLDIGRPEDYELAQVWERRE